LSLSKTINESKRLFKLGIPLIVSQIAIVGMSVTDTLMAGRFATDDLAAVAVATGLWYPLLVLLIGIISGVSPMMAQRYGKGNFNKLGEALLQSSWLAILLGALTAGIIFIALPAISLLDTTDSIKRISSGYLSAIGFGVIGLALATVFRFFCEANGNTKTPMIINIAAFLINIVLDYVFVFGKLGMPALGGVGCGYATALIYWITALFLMLHALRAKRYSASVKTIELAPPNKAEISEIVRIGLPASIGICAEVAFFGIVAVLLTPFGGDMVAAHQIALNVSSVIFMIPLGMSMAIAIRVGHLIGQGDAEHARFSAFLTIALTCSLAVITAILTVLLRGPIIALYTDDSTVFSIAYNLIILSAIFQFIDAIQVVSAAALRGYKDTKIPMVIQVFSYWCVGFTFSWSLSLGNITGSSWEAEGFWVGFVAGLTAAGILLLARLNRVSRKQMAS